VGNRKLPFRWIAGVTLAWVTPGLSCLDWPIEGKSLANRSEGSVDPGSVDRLKTFNGPGGPTGRRENSGWLGRPGVGGVRPAQAQPIEVRGSGVTGPGPAVLPSLANPHVAAFKAQLDLVRSHVESGHRAAKDAAEDQAAATAQAAAEEECFRAVVDLREAAQRLDRHKFEDKAQLLDCCDHKAVFVPSDGPLSMFNSTTWTECFSEFWFGDCLPNMQTQEPKLTFEELFETLPDREELEYQLDSDAAPYRAKSQSRFDTPEHAIVFGDTLRRLLLFKGTRMALRRKGFQKDVKLIAESTSEQCVAALQASAGQPGDLKDAAMEGLVGNEKVSAELKTALKQVLISTKDVPLTDGYKRSLRHEGHNLNVTEGALVVFATFNFADTYSPVLFRLVQEGVYPGSAAPPALEIKCNLTDDAPDLPSLQQMHQLIAESPRAQAKFFLLMDDIADVYFMGMDQSFVGRHHVAVCN